MDMIQLPRIAVGTVQRSADMQVMTWALMNVLERSGVHVQLFSPQSRFATRDAALRITGQSRRHLDSWLMTPETCIELFSRGTRFADIGLVEGQYDVARQAFRGGGSLDTLCQWLDLPSLVTIDARLLDAGHPLPLPSGAVGLLLDNVADVAELCRLQTEFEALCGIPVLGWLDRLTQLRAVVSDLLPDDDPTPELCHALGDALAPCLRLEQLLQIASQRPFSEAQCQLFRHRCLARPLRVAVAFDNAFNCYFPDALDALESQGATVSVFSPLQGDCLPGEPDVVYLGSGRPEEYLDRLAANCCIKESLWNHVISGGRIYAESAGLAYLCREIVMPGGDHWPMVGLLPALARRNPSPAADRPVEITVAKDSWLFSRN
ncbi:MAG: hypothetical protein FJ276_25095, partial [Planctomycetes bacterium]|nr:hypothetical protein [Planctomycetota bacterium]